MSEKQFATGAKVKTTKEEESSNIINRGKTTPSYDETSITPITSEPKLNDPTHSNKLQTFIIRTIWTFVMIGVFFFHFGCRSFLVYIISSILSNNNLQRMY